MVRLATVATVALSASSIRPPPSCKNTALTPASYRVQARKPVRIAYNPQASCGSSIITPANTATAALYNYTPYQPNEAAKNDGDDCSSWGNLNFYGFWKVWFGSPH